MGAVTGRRSAGVGFGLGAMTVQAIHAQAKPPVYYVAEVDVKDMDAYTNMSRALRPGVKAAGGRVLTARRKITPLDDAPPKPRVAIQQWESLEKLQAYRNSAAFKEARKIGDKYAKFRRSR